MQYEILFEIGKASPHGFGFIGLGFSIVTVCLFMRYRLGTALQRQWRWGLAIGAVCIAQGGWSYISSQQLIRNLETSDKPKIIEGLISGAGQSWNRRSGRSEYFNIGHRHFNYLENEPDSPFPLITDVGKLVNGQHVRLAVLGGHIVKVERQLCLVYHSCTVHYVFGLRYEQEIEPI